MTRQKLVEEAKSKGIDVPARATRADVARLLQEHDQATAAMNGGAPQAEATPVNGFIVEKVDTGDGKIGVNIGAIGNATMLEAVSVLAMALAAAKKNVGME